MRAYLRPALLAIALIGAAAPARADVISDWNEQAVAFVVANHIGPPPGERIIAMTQVAMFDAINSIDRKYRPYLAQLPAASTTSREAAAATAAANVLAAVNPKDAPEIKEMLKVYLAKIADGDAKTEGIRLGEAIAAKVMAARADDGSNAPDTYRPRTSPGIYVTTIPAAVPQWPGVKPFAMTSGAQFRPGPPPALTSPQWADAYNEMKAYGSRTSTKRSARQTEDARFWLATDGRVYYPVLQQIAAAKELSVVDCARLYALVAVARADAMIAVFDAKYHYEFWRPVTAIRNGDIDGNAATERDPAWQPIDATPMHPEYPCAHCIQAAALTGVVQTVFGSADIPEVKLQSPTAPGVTHRWTNLRAYTDEVSEARIWAGFHWRFSTEVARQMGYGIGEYTVKSVMQPVTAANR